MGGQQGEESPEAGGAIETRTWGQPPAAHRNSQKIVTFSIFWAIFSRRARAEKRTDYRKSGLVLGAARTGPRGRAANTRRTEQPRLAHTTATSSQRLFGLRRPYIGGVEPTAAVKPHPRKVAQREAKRWPAVTATAWTKQSSCARVSDDVSFCQTGVVQAST